MAAHAHRVQADRERFLGGAGGAGSLRVRSEIADSWRRSALSGVPADRVPDVPIDDLSERYSRLLRAANPVLDRLADDLAGTVTSIMMTDPQARILARRVGEPSMQSALDRILAVPGARYSEEVVGTNGLGTVIERRRPTMVAGPEHFHDMLRSLTCVGAPLVHPVTGRLEGVLDLTCRFEETSPLMLPMVLEAARDITRRLYELSSVAERLLLERYLSAARRSSGPLIALNRELIIANPVAARALEPGDHALLWQCAEAAIGLGRPSEELVLSGGVVARVHVEPVSNGADVVGALIELKRTGTSNTPGTIAAADEGLPGLAGRSLEWRHVTEQVRQYAHSTLGVAVLGEAGVGKMAVVGALHALGVVQRDVATVDVALVPAEGERAWLARVAALVTRPGQVILRHVDLLPAELAHTVASLTERADPGCRLVVTAREGWPDDAPRRLVDRFPARLVVPPLARRTDDLPVLLPAIATRFGASGLRWPAGVIQALARCPWPGNVRELASLVERIAARRTAGDVEVGDLPSEYRCAPGPRGLTSLEQLERAAIVDALEQSKGTKIDAAAALGISRSTLYRKLSSYGIDLDQPAF